jgi:hypothetical protein
MTISSIMKRRKTADIFKFGWKTADSLFPQLHLLQPQAYCKQDITDSQKIVFHLRGY